MLTMRYNFKAYNLCDQKKGPTSLRPVTMTTVC